MVGVLISRSAPCTLRREMWHSAFIWIISLTAIGCVLLRPCNLVEAWWACAGAGVLLVTGLISPAESLVAARKGVDVYLFLTGMMILSELARAEGVFDWIAEQAAVHARGSSRRLFVLIYLAGTAVTIFLSNDATAVVLTPAVLTIARRLEIAPFPHLIVCAFIANAASFVLPISNPANLVVFGRNMPHLAQWLWQFALPSVVSVVGTFFLLRFVCREYLKQPIRADPGRTRLSMEGRVALAGLAGAAGILLTASGLGWDLGASTCGVAVVVTLIVTLRNRTIPMRVAKGVAWSVIPLVAGFFIILQALLGAGALEGATKFLRYAANAGRPLNNLLAGFGTGLLSNVMNNLPVGFLAGGTAQASEAGRALNGALLVGVDLGPNLSVTGSLATILWLIALRRENVEITAGQFLRIGLFVMPISLLLTLLAL